MAQLELSPLQLYFRYYAARQDTNTTGITQAAVQTSALERLAQRDLEQLIAFIEEALKNGDESSNRKLFLDGHHVFQWHTSNAATGYLRDLLLGAMRVRDGSSVNG